MDGLGIQSIALILCHNFECANHTKFLGLEKASLAGYNDLVCTTV